MANTNVRPGNHTNEIRRLATLLEVSQALSGALSLKTVLHSLLELLERRHQVAGSTVTLLDETSRELHVEASGGIRLGSTRTRDRAGRHDHPPGHRLRAAGRRPAGQPGTGAGTDDRDRGAS